MIGWLTHRVKARSATDAGFLRLLAGDISRDGSGQREAKRLREIADSLERMGDLPPVPEQVGEEPCACCEQLGGHTSWCRYHVETAAGEADFEPVRHPPLAG